MSGPSSPKQSAAEIVINMVAPTILLQLTLAASRYSPDTLKEDNYALGYIFGYHDAVLQALKVDDHSSIFTIMAASYNNIFSDQTVAAQLLRKSLESQHDATFMNGAIKGGGDAISSVREKQIQMGLFTWLTR